jgi:type I restriction enzyme S subunit
MEERAHTRWIAYCLLSGVGQSQFGGLLYGGTKDGLALQDVKDLRVLLPPLSEQRALVDYLDEKNGQIDALIQRVKEGMVRLKEYRTALISAAVTGQIDVREK